MVPGAAVTEDLLFGDDGYVYIYVYMCVYLYSQTQGRISFPFSLCIISRHICIPGVIQIYAHDDWYRHLGSNSSLV